MDKKFIIILVVVVLGLGSIFFVGKLRSKAPDTTTNGQITSHVTGSGNGNVNLVVYGDFQCPICEQYYPIEKQLLNQYGSSMTLTFMHFPLDSIHPNARAGARAAEAAGMQGKFFEMHDLLYDNQSAWSTSSSPLPIFTSYAQQLGLNTEQFQTDFSSETVNNAINADLKDGNSKGVSGTPTYYLNGQKLDNSNINSYEKFAAVIESAIQQANGQ